MKERVYLKALYILCALSVFLPWFTYDANIMGYCWGYNFLKWLLIPMLVVAIYLFQPDRSTLFTVLSELSIFSVFTVLVVAFGRWQEVCNINTGFQWKDGFHTALPTFWLTVLLFMVFFILFQWDLVKYRKQTKPPV